jgi:hypothetical protein
VHHLGQLGLHPRALAGGKDDGESRGLGHAGLGRCRFTPWRSSKKRAPRAGKELVTLKVVNPVLRGSKAESLVASARKANCLIQSQDEGHNPRVRRARRGPGNGEIDR